MNVEFTNYFIKSTNKIKQEAVKTKIKQFIHFKINILYQINSLLNYENKT